MSLNNKGFTNIEIFTILLVFSVIYLVGIVNTSHAFSDETYQIAYDSKINLIKTQAQSYAFENIDLFKEKDVIYIYVTDLIDQGYITADEDGNVINPLEVGETLNNLKIKLVKKGDKVEVSFVTL